MSEMPPPPPGAPYHYGGSPPPDKGFFGRLFDLDFTSFITPSIVKIIYVLSIAIGAIYGLFMFFGGLASLGDSAAGILLVLLAPVVFILFVVYARVALEVIMTLFRIAENTESLRNDRR